MRSCRLFGVEFVKNLDNCVLRATFVGAFDGWGGVSTEAFTISSVCDATGLPKNTNVGK